MKINVMVTIGSMLPWPKSSSLGATNGMSCSMALTIVVLETSLAILVCCSGFIRTASWAAFNSFEELMSRPAFKRVGAIVIASRSYLKACSRLSKAYLV